MTNFFNYKALITSSLCVALSISLSACGPVHNRSTEYVDAKNDPSLKFPKDVSTDKLKNYYPIPETSNPDEKVVAADLTPPGLLEAQEQAVEAQKAAKQAAKEQNNSEQPESESANTDTEAATGTKTEAQDS